MRDRRFDTNYPERYRPVDHAPAFSEYEPCLPVPIGKSMSAALPGILGTIVTHISSIGDGEYFLDPDLAFHGHEGATHYIWLRDSWQEFEITFGLHAGFRQTSDVRRVMEGSQHDKATDGH
jgi:hypothetical protein